MPIEREGEGEEILEEWLDICGFHRDESGINIYHTEDEEELVGWWAEEMGLVEILAKPNRRVVGDPILIHGEDQMVVRTPSIPVGVDAKLETHSGY